MWPLMAVGRLSEGGPRAFLVDDEWLYRENRKLTARLKVAKFNERAACLEAIDYATPRGLRKDQIFESPVVAFPTPPYVIGTGQRWHRAAQRVRPDLDWP